MISVVQQNVFPIIYSFALEFAPNFGYVENFDSFSNLYSFRRMMNNRWWKIAYFTQISQNSRNWRIFDCDNVAEKERGFWRAPLSADYHTATNTHTNTNTLDHPCHALVTADRNFYEEAIKLFRGSRRWHQATTTGGGAITGSSNFLPLSSLGAAKGSWKLYPPRKGERVSRLSITPTSLETFIKS